MSPITGDVLRYFCLFCGHGVTVKRDGDVVFIDRYHVHETVDDVAGLGELALGELFLRPLKLFTA